MVECWAIREGLKLALDRNLFGILIETDSRASTQLIMEETLDSHELGNIIFDCRSMLRTLGSEVKHIFREADVCADVLAGLSAVLPIWKI
ncbi:hypothetical protein C3L33_05454, partial [Rhododendron williamsianum]